MDVVLMNYNSWYYIDCGSIGMIDCIQPKRVFSTCVQKTVVKTVIQRRNNPSFLLLQLTLQNFKIDFFIWFFYSFKFSITSFKAFCISKAAFQSFLMPLQITESEKKIYLKNHKYEILRHKKIGNAR